MTTRRFGLIPACAMVVVAKLALGCAPAAPSATPVPTPPASSSAARPAGPPEKAVASVSRPARARLAETFTATEGRAVRLGRGDTAVFGPWRVTWAEIHDGLVRLHAQYRDDTVAAWDATDDAPMATHDAETGDRLRTFEVRLVATVGALEDEGGRVDIVGRSVDRARAATFAESLAPGVYAFPDGLRVHVEQITGCDYDPSAPCPFGGSYRADAALGDETVHVELKTRQTRILGHTLELGRDRFAVRR